MTGIRIGEGVPLPAYKDTAYRDASATIEQFFPDASFGTYSSGGIKLSEIGDYLGGTISYMNKGNSLDPIVLARAFLFYTLGALFFPNGNSTILVGWLSYIDDVGKVGEYDWGSAILARIYYALDTCSRRKIRSMDCFWQFIEYFFYEYTHASTPVLREAETDYWPRLK